MIPNDEPCGCSEYQELSRRNGTRVAALSPDEFGAFVRSEIENWGEAVRSAGIEPQ